MNGLNQGHLACLAFALILVVCALISPWLRALLPPGWVVQ